MCLSNNFHDGTAPVSFTDTIVFGADYLDSDGTPWHLLGYSNKVSVPKGGASERMSYPIGTSPEKGLLLPLFGDNADFGWAVPAVSAGDFGWGIPPAPPGDAMLIAIPAKPGTMTADDLIPVGKFPNFMEDFRRAVAPPAMSDDYADFSLSMAPKAAAIVVKGFDSGTYDVVIAWSAAAIADVIQQVDEAKRPQINAALYGELDALYPSWTFVLFCFAGDAAEKAGCALMRYQPMRPDLLYLPGLDGHDGRIDWDPVTLDHTIVVSSYLLHEDAPNARAVKFRDAGVKDSIPSLPRVVIGRSYSGIEVPQGDFLFRLEDVRRGKFRCLRSAPPGKAQTSLRYLE